MKAIQPSEVHDISWHWSEKNLSYQTTDHEDKRFYRSQFLADMISLSHL